MFNCMCDMVYYVYSVAYGETEKRKIIYRKIECFRGENAVYLFQTYDVRLKISGFSFHVVVILVHIGKL